jgi:hypothetical protein
MRGGPMSHPDENSNTNPVTSQSGKAPEPQTPDAPGQQQAKNSSSSQPDTPDRRTAGRNVGMRSRLLPLVLTALMVLSAILTDPAAAGASRGSEPTAGRPPLNRALARLVLSPAQASIRSGASQAYTATGYDAAGHELGDATTQTSFSINQDGSCTGASCMATKGGRHTITGTVHLGNRVISDTATLQVVPPGPVEPPHPTVEPIRRPVAPPHSPVQSPRGRGESSGRPVAPSQGPAESPRHQVGRSLPLARLVMSPARVFMPSGGKVTYHAEGYDAAGHPLGDVTAQTSLSIRFSAAKTSRQIRPDGSCTEATCTATKLGRHTVTGTVDLGNETISGTAAVQVVPRHRRMGRPQPLARLELSPSTATIQAGEHRDYTAEGYDAAGHDLGDYTAYTSFSIDLPGACTGTTCTATRTGDYTVTGTVTGTKVTGTAILHVGAGPLAKLRLGPSEATIQAGGQVTYHADGADAYGNPLGELTAKTGFSIDPPGACTGTTCTATRTGDYTVTGTVTGTKVTGTAILHVGAGPLATLELQPGEATIGVGATQAYIARGFDADHHRLGDYTTRTRFSIKEPNGSCTQDSCGATQPGDYTVTGTVTGTKVTGTAKLRVESMPPNCATSARDVRDLQVTPRKGTPGTEVHITAKLDQKFANCPQRIFLDGSGSGVDVTVGPDGSISVRRSVPDDAKPGITPVRLATTDGRTLAQASFQVIPKPMPNWLRWLLFAIAALLLLVLAVLAILAERARRRRWARQHVRAKSHPSSDDVTVDQDPQSAPTFSVRLQPHGDAGTQTMEEGDR